MGPKTSAALAAKFIPRFMFQVCYPHHLRHCRVLSSMLDQIAEDGGVFQQSSKMHRPCVVAIWLVWIGTGGQKLSHSSAVFRDHCCMQEIIPHGAPEVEISQWAGPIPMQPMHQVEPDWNVFGCFWSFFSLSSCRLSTNEKYRGLFMHMPSCKNAAGC